MFIALLVCAALGCRSIDDTPRPADDPQIRTFPQPRYSVDVVVANQSVRVSRKGPTTTFDRDEALLLQDRLIKADIEGLVASQIEKIFSGPVVEEAMTVRMRRSDDSSLGWLLVSGATLFSLNLIGMPFHHVTENVEIAVIVGSEGDRRRPRIRVVGSGSAWTAVWWGYNVEDARRQASRRAARDALGRLEAALAGKAEEIRERLLR